MSDNSKDNIVKEEINLQLKLYLLFFLIIYSISFLIPGFLFFYFILSYFGPIVLHGADFLSIFTRGESLFVLAIAPGFLICLYLLHLFLMALATRWLWRYTEKKSPSKNGIIPRNIHSKASDYYHVRSFMIKYPKNAFIKGPFPWLSNWMFNFVGTNKIGKGTTIEEQVCADKFIDVGKNCYIGPNSVLTSHLVDGIFGNISYFEIKLGDNVTFAGLDCIASGTEIGSNSYLLPFACTGKHNILKGNNYYFGIPLRKIFKKKIGEYLNFSNEDVEKEKELKQKQREVRDD